MGTSQILWEMDAGTCDVFFMTTYPTSPGFKTTTTETSALAAVRINGRAALLRDRVLNVLHDKIHTADEVAEILGESILSVRPRLSELNALGLIEPTVFRRKNISGHSAVVWTVSKPGQGELI